MHQTGRHRSANPPGFVLSRGPHRLKLTGFTQCRHRRRTDLVGVVFEQFQEPLFGVLVAKLSQPGNGLETNRQIVVLE